MRKITVYSTNNCIQCKMTEKFLKAHNVQFSEKNINQNPQYIDQLKSEGFMAMPVVKATGIKAFSGFRPDKLNQLAV